MAERDTSPDDLVLIAEIGGVHGIQGEVRVKLYSDNPAALTAYGPLQDAAGIRFKIKKHRPSKTVFVCRIEGVADRTAAEKLNGTKLFIPRDRLPAPEEDEFYHIDLIGLAAKLPDGQILGQIQAVFDFGAGDILEIKPPKGALMLVPFTREFVPDIDLAAGHVIITQAALGVGEQGDEVAE